MASRFTSEVLALIGRDLLYDRMTKQVAVASPGAGLEWSVNVPGGVIWEVISVTARLTTDATVVNRSPDLQIVSQDGQVQTAIPPGTSIAASIAANLYWNRGIRSSWVAGANKQPIPLWEQPVIGGFKITTSTLNLQAADAWTAIMLAVREWDETALFQEAMELFVGLEEYIESGYREGSDY